MLVFCLTGPSLKSLVQARIRQEDLKLLKIETGIKETRQWISVYILIWLSHKLCLSRHSLIQTKQLSERKLKKLQTTSSLLTRERCAKDDGALQLANGTHVILSFHMKLDM